MRFLVWFTALLLVVAGLQTACRHQVEQAFADPLPDPPQVMTLGPLQPLPGDEQKIVDIAWDKVVQKPGYDGAYTPQKSAQYLGQPTPEHVKIRDDRSITFLGYGLDGRNSSEKVRIG